MAMPRAEKTQNSEVTSASMHEISLANDDPEEQAPGTIEKIPSKSSSLKRFFKLGLNKKVTNDGNHENAENVENADNTGTDADTEDGNEEIPSKIEQDVEHHEAHKDSAEEIKRSRSRRFNFRFHGSTVENETPSSSAHATDISRHSLRGSLSTYFNSVFKRKQNANSKHSMRFSKKKELNITPEEQEPKLEANKEGIQHKVCEDSDIQSQTAEIINEIETLTISEQSTAISLVQE